MASIWDQARALTEKLRQRAGGVVSQVAQSPLGQRINNFVTDFPTNTAYIQAQIGKTILPKETLPTAEEMQNFDPRLNPIPDLTGEPIKSMSAQMNTWPVIPQTSYNQRLEQQKQEVLNSGAFRSAMRRYLSTVPIYGEPGIPGGGITDTTPLQTFDYKREDTIPSWELSEGPYQPVIGIGLSNPNNNTNEIIAHELIHAAPRQMKYKQDFQNFFENLNPKSNPVLYNVGLQYFRNGNPPPNPEELYATMAEQMGPRVLEVPEIKKFFINLFNQE